MEIITAGLTKELIISETGLQVQPHIELSEVRVEEYEGDYYSRRRCDTYEGCRRTLFSHPSVSRTRKN